VTTTAAVHCGPARAETGPGTHWRAVHQVVPSLLPGDAVGTHVLGLQRGLRQRGLVSEVYAEATTAETARMARPAAELLDGEPQPRTVVLYHFASGSGLADRLAARPEPMVVVFHNVTPPHLMAAWAPEVAWELVWARRQLAELAASAELGIGVSEFNAADLRRAGYRQVAVAPIVVDPARWPSERTGEGVSSSGAPTVLYVGRVAPNKGLLELVAAVPLLRRLVPEVRVVIVGSTESVPAYSEAVRSLAAATGVDDAVTLTGRLDDAGLANAYATADVLCSLSVHEGFGVPLLEAMHAGVPVVALAAAAVPETARGAALLLPDADPCLVATALHRVLTDGDLAARMVAAGHRRVAAVDPSLPVDALLSALATLPAPMGQP